MPFVTEELWTKLKPQSGFIMVQNFPDILDEDDKKAENLIGCLMDVTKAVRQARSDFGLNPGIKLSPMVLTTDQELRELLINQGPLLLKLMGAEKLTLAESEMDRPKNSAANVLYWGQVWTPLIGLIDPEAERARLDKEAQKLGKDIKSAQDKLANPEYINKAPEDIVAETKTRLENMETRLAAVKRALEVVKNLDLALPN
jgi:valyl-tRNA synthetase